MFRLPLFTFNSRARSTSWGIAFCAMFLVASFSVIGGLRTSMDTLSDNFEPEYTLVTKPAGGQLGFFDPYEYTQLSDGAAFGIIVPARTSPVFESSPSVNVICVVDPNDVLPEKLAPVGSNALAGINVPAADDVNIWPYGSEEDAVTVHIAGQYSSTIFSPDMLICSEDVLRELSDQEGTVFNFAIVSHMTEDDASALSADGFDVTPMIGVVEFLDSSVQEIEEDAFWVLIPSAFVVAVLAYGYIGSEIADRRHDIGIIKTIGAGRLRVFSYLVASAVLICSWGALLGLALGTIASYGISTAASAAFTSVFVVDVQESVLILSFIVTVAAGVAGSLIPTMRMTLTRPVEDLKEAIRFS